MRNFTKRLIFLFIFGIVAGNAAGNLTDNHVDGIALCIVFALLLTWIGFKLFPYQP